MTTLDLSDPAIQQHIKSIQDGSDQVRWAAFGYVPKTNNKIKLYDHGPGDLKELREDLGDSTIRFVYMRFIINNMKKFLYIGWCPDGVAGPIKGSFGSHFNDFSKILKPIHYQLNARNEDDLDEKSILAQLTKGTGASYDSGAKVQGSTKAFVPTSVSQGREQATKSNAEVKTVINKQDYNKTTESTEFWKKNQAVKDEPVKPSRPEYNITTERDQYWQQQQQQPTSTTTSNSNRPTGPVSRTVANKFQQMAIKDEPTPPPSKPVPSRTLANKFPQSNASSTTSSYAPPPPRSTQNKPVVHEEPVYEEPQYQEEQQQYDDQSYQQEEQQQQYEEQQYQQEEQQYDDQSYQQEEQQQQYDDQQQYQQEEQQQYDDQSYQQEEQQQQYDDQSYQQQSSGHVVKAVYDYQGENEGDLSFKEGDYISVLDQSDPDGWWQGTVISDPNDVNSSNGVTGFFPCNFIQEL